MSRKNKTIETESKSMVIQAEGGSKNWLQVSMRELLGMMELF